jgi:hypothetical protein
MEHVIQDPNCILHLTSYDTNLIQCVKFSKLTKSNLTFIAVVTDIIHPMVASLNNTKAYAFWLTYET